MNKLFVLYHVLVLFSSAATSENWAKNIWWSELISNDDMLPTKRETALIQSETNLTRMQCAYKGKMNKQCSSFFYNEDTGACKLYSTIFVTHQQLTRRDGFRYYEITHKGCPQAACFRYLRQENVCLYWKSYAHLPNIQQLDFSQAKEVCENKASTLLVWNTSSRNDVFVKFALNNFDVYREHPPGTLSFIAGTREDGNSPWKWQNDDLSLISSYLLEPPKDDELCVTLCTNSARFGWKAHPCSFKLGNVFCERSLEGV